MDIWKLLGVLLKMKNEDKYNQEVMVSNLFYEIIMILSNNCMVSELKQQKLKRRIALYGIGRVGEVLIKLCTMLEMDIVYVIDKKDIDIWNELKVFHPGDELPDVDVIIISSVAYTDEMCKSLSERRIDTYITASDFLTEIINFPLRMNFKD